MSANTDSQLTRQIEKLKISREDNCNSASRQDPGSFFPSNKVMNIPKKQEAFSKSHESSLSSVSSLATEAQLQADSQEIQNNNNVQSQPQSQPQSSHSSFRRKNSVRMFNRSHFSLSPMSPNSSNASSAFPSINSSPNDSFLREGPKIHSKLYCEDLGLNNKSAKDVLSRLSTDELRSVKTHTELAETANGVRMLAKNLSRATIQLDVKAILIITKARDNSLVYLTKEVVEWLLSQHEDMTIYVDSKLENSKRFNSQSIIQEYPVAKKQLKYWNKQLTLKSPELFDLVVTLGGDGTVLYVSNLFQKIVPPVLSFALGSLGFLTNFKFGDYKEHLNQCIASGVKANLRMRFTCRVHTAEGKLLCEQQVLNELVVDRGPSPFVTMLELYGDGSLLTVAQADGLIIATPTGSTAYSLSAGGSLVHPGVSAISVTPVCPHTLSFRPILLPDGMFLKVKVPSSSRSTAWCSFDGRVRTELKKGYYVTVQASPFPFPTVISSKTEYIDSVSRNLHWNIREQQKPFSSYLKPETKRLLAETQQGGAATGGGGDGGGGDAAAKDAEEDFDINNDDNYQVLEVKSNSSQEASETTSEDFTYLPSSGGTQTPHNANYQNEEERCCYAHPHARIHLNGDKNG
ncbi:UTR1 [Candida oxycetoniae]|uniref:UTR1 n=1 Tax=Candida oxycetoniae TaxID=497107 RepID=A0AAI9WZA4_9ASCO|nr:UTR1 [Candida oxycetoniae]KAI3406206.2 UTR1 [Candida oxycetoniae]